jgi:hypothetical protein
MHTTPTFDRALARYEELMDQGLEDTAEGRAVFATVLKNAPPDFMAMAAQFAKEMDLLPCPAGLDANGRPVYNLKDVCAKFGVGQEEALAMLNEAGADSLTTTPPAMRAH